jgi:hypothetical protein
MLQNGSVKLISAKLKLQSSFPSTLAVFGIDGVPDTFIGRQRFVCIFLAATTCLVATIQFASAGGSKFTTRTFAFPEEKSIFGRSGATDNDKRPKCIAGHGASAGLPCATTYARTVCLVVLTLAGLAP